MEKATLISLLGINTFLNDIYEKEYRISDILSKHDFSDEQISILKNNYLCESILILTKSIEKYIIEKHDGIRLYEIINKHYGYDGNKPLSLRKIGSEYSISGERVRQLINKSIRIFKTQKAKAYITKEVILNLRENIKDERI